jgi:hydrogenase maturation protein HypF
MVVVDPAPLVAALVGSDAPAPVKAAGFHRTVGETAARVAIDLARAHDLRAVVLTGGVFQNVRLTAVVSAALESAGLEVLTHRAVPPNDGGLSVGQAAVAAARLGAKA